MKKKLIAIGTVGLLLGLPTTVSANSHWPGSEDVLIIESNLNALDELLTEKESIIVDLNENISTLEVQHQEANERIVALEKEAQLSQETKDKAQAFDVITKTIKDESGIDIHTGNYQSILTRLTELYHNSGFVRNAVRKIIGWLF